ncbi:hypothetical protein F66182_2975 [Fusarium sp. NRRL 66182]|nr:hypothetical protein F66182_2975 [Fusarium sp. NRRL 66182]
MSNYLYGYGVPHGYQTPQPYRYAPNHTYNETSFHPSETTEIQPSSCGQGATEAYGYNQTAIPGLGMGFSHNVASMQSAWPQTSFEAQPNPSNSIARNQMTESYGNTTLDVTNSRNQQPDVGTNVDAMEEGELSEGELEDIYEAGETEANDDEKHSIRVLDPLSNSGRQGESSQVYGASARSWNPKQFGRERSGSYSPYLSPREIQSSGVENETSHSGILDPSASEPALSKTTLPEYSGRDDYLTRPTETRQADRIISESKKRAEEAILGLWPLNVRYQNYVEEGVDRALLNELFLELGLELGTTVSSQEQPNLSTLQVTEAPTAAPGTQTTSTKATTDVDKPKDMNQAKDKSEERKDRIARLLAAKGTKSGAASSGDGKPSVLVPVPEASAGNTKSEKTKTQSEKSKLIQQKMEALMKAREANAKAIPLLPEPSLLPPAPETRNSQSLTPADPMSLEDKSATMPETTDAALAPSIPGLFLSSNAPSPTHNQRKRPVAADLNDNSTAVSPKRPFGQARESRPFLIDVSDDEDDAEMEIDSPELRPSSIQRPMTPGSRTTSFRDHPALPDSASRHTISSPKTANTPTTSANGMYDLESMTKKIEDMKRKIAEAEARKNAKKSGNNSPLPQSHSQSKEGSVDVALSSVPMVRATSATVDATTAEAVQESPASNTPQSPPSSHATTDLPKVGDQHRPIRPSLRARVASERLPILEARRREQAEQLKRLQSEVSRIEKDIENSLVEEEQLRKDTLQAEREALYQNESGFCVRQGETSDRPPQYESVQDNTTAEAAQSMEVIHSYNETEQDSSMYEPLNPGSVEDLEVTESYNDEPRKDEPRGMQETIGNSDHSLLSADSSSTHHTADKPDGIGCNHVEEPEDKAMEEAVTSSEEEDAAEESSDDYEPTDAGISLSDPQSPIPRQSPRSRVLPVDNAVLETSDADIQDLATATPITQPISAGNGDTESEADGEAENPTTPKVRGDPKTSFVPYETPLRYFRAYRFHPQYSDSVSGGLRSLTYSNKIDVTREVCPDQLTRGVCPRGSECQFQHFENMQVPDDQILLQLGSYGNYEQEQRRRFVEGLRELLTDFHVREVKDFDAISQGIIQYRARFHGDKTKILPLGGVTL